MAHLYRPKEAFVAPHDGHDYSFTRDTFVEAGHPILSVYPHLFEEIEPHLKAPVVEKQGKRSVESATAAPGEKRNR